MKELRTAADFSQAENNELNLLKALVQFSIQVESREIDLKDLFRAGRKAKHDPNETELVWGRGSNPPHDLNRQRSSSTEGGKCDRVPLTKYLRRAPLSRKNHKSKETEFPSQDDSLDQHMSLQQQLAITALNLTAPACSTILRNHRNNWVQLSGHPGSLAPAGPGTIWKKQPGGTNESWVYEALMKDVAREVVPKFYKEITYEGERFIEISDLLHGFNNPSMMDIKVGNRTFLESEVTNNKARNDLYLKMMKVDSSAPSPEEHEAKAITKLRYMDFRDNMSSSRSLSFRVEALKMSESSSVTELKRIRTKEEVVEVFESFVKRKEFVKKQILSRLKKIKSTFEASEFFKNHEVIGSSILIVYDETRVGAWVIDFAKTCKLPEGVIVNHRSEWRQGNHEEGYLTGLENIINCFEEVSVNKNKKKLFSKS